MVERRIELDLDKSHDRRVAVRMGAGDMNATTIVAEIFDNNAPVDLTGMDVTLVMRLGDGTVMELPCSVDGGVATVTVNERDIGRRRVHVSYMRVDDGDVTYSTERFDVVMLEGHVAD